MSSKINNKNLYLHKDLEQLKNEIEIVMSEHDKFAFETHKDAAKWVGSLQIDCLSSSLKYEKDQNTGKILLCDFKKKKQLQKQYNYLKQKTEILLSCIIESRIDLLLKEIENINKDENIST